MRKSKATPKGANKKQTRPRTVNREHLRFLEKAEIFSRISLCLFIADLVISLIVIIVSHLNMGIWAGLFLLYYGVFALIPIVISTAWAIAAAWNYHKFVRLGHELTKQQKWVRVITLTQLLIFVALYIGFSVLICSN